MSESGISMAHLTMERIDAFGLYGTVDPVRLSVKSPILSPDNPREANGFVVGDTRTDVLTPQIHLS